MSAPSRREVCRRHTGRLKYSHDAFRLLVKIWDAAGYPWSVRLKAMFPAWLLRLR